MFISLYDVKKHNNYTYIEVSPPAGQKEPDYLNGETWLSQSNGFSYQLIDQVAGTWERIEKTQDTKILAIEDDVFKNTICYLQNFFPYPRNTRYDDPDKNYNQVLPSNFTREDAYVLYFNECTFSEFTFSSTTKTLTINDTDNVWGSLESFNIGDIIFIGNSLRNNGFFTVTSRTSNVLAVSEDIINSVSNAFIFLVSIPQPLLEIIAKMIWYDVFVRKGIGLKNERIGTYSYTKEEIVGGLSYPLEIVGGLNCFEDIATGGTSVYVS